jgi:5-bromo-4-chloroindolyl phosphate hydrolysis protein
MRRGDLEYIQTFNTNPAPINLPSHRMLALNERAIQMSDLRGDRLNISRQLGGLGRKEPARLQIVFLMALK